jgi:hypothetical protein
VDDLSGLPAGADVTVLLTFASPAELQAWQELNDSGARPPLADDPYYKTRSPDPPLVRWSYWNGAEWAVLSPTISVVGVKWQLTFKIPADMTALGVGGRTARWLRATLEAWPKAAVPAINGLEVSAHVIRSGITPELALSAGRPVDLSMDFFPLGERPRLNDTFYVASAEALSQPEATVTVTVKPSEQQEKTLKATDKPTLAWEVPTPSGWVRLQPLPTETTTPAPTIINNNVLRETSINLPKAVVATEVHGKRAHWLRVRLVSGDFGKGVEIKERNGINQPVDDGYRPPILEKLTLGYERTSGTTTPT